VNYKETLAWMFSKLPMYQRQGKTAFKKDLTNIVALAGHLGHPQQQFKSIHVAGTNGKGSTSHMIASILQEAGYKTGLYTSPHLRDFRERIKVNGKMIRKNCVINFIKRNHNFLERQQLSFFEMTVGLAFEYFAKQQIDIAVVEVGLGGRLDSTNILNPEISVITNIGYDHTQFLGETLPEIAFEKAGIIKENTPVIIGENQPEVIDTFMKIAKENHTNIAFAEDVNNTIYKTSLAGSYQSKNSKTAVAAIKKLNNFIVKEEDIKKGLLKVVENTGLLGRWQLLREQPKVIVDTAHNKEGLTYALRQLLEEKFENLHIIIGVVNDKNLETILPMFPKRAQYYFCKPTIPRGLDAQLLQQKAQGYQLLGNTYNSVNKAYKSALKTAIKNDLIFIGGSTFVVAEVV